MKKRIMALSLAGVLLVGTFAFVLSNQKLNKLGSVNALDCSHNHVNHYSEVAPTLETSGVAEYWVCCDCHTSFKDEGLTEAFANTSGSPSDSTDGRYLAPLGEADNRTFMGDSFLSASAVTSAEPAPAGYAFTNVYQLENGNIRNLFSTDANLDGINKLAFAVKAATKWFSCRNDWAWSSGSWKIFELVQTAPETWDIYGATAGNALALKHSSISGNNLYSILNFTSENDTCYVTNFRVIKQAPFESTITTFMGDSFIGSGMTLSAEPAPEGYAFTNVYQITGANISAMLNANAVVDGLSAITFAVKSSIWYTFRGTDASPSWKIFELIKTSAGTWNMYRTYSGGTLTLMHEGISGHTLSQIMNFGSANDASFYMTNLRVMKEVEFESIESAHLGSGMTLSAEPAPEGYAFTNVYQITGANITAMLNSNAVVDGFRAVTFAVKSSIWYTFRGTDASPSWKIFELIKTAPGTWDIYRMYSGGSVTLVHEGVSGHTLSGIMNFGSANDASFYTTNLRVMKEAETKIAESAVAGSELVNDMHSSFLQFDQVSKKSLPENQGQPFIVNPNLDGVATAEFAFLTKNRSFCDNTWGVALAKDTWFLAKFTINGANDVSCSIYAADGTLKFSYANKASFAAALPYYNYSGENLMEFYCTEILATIA